jgi:RHH-type proline utilization regulon transcriptional repressor/proline dehydrogenase/delta 1-pyrroline-5-carboxylate dehydrogenase
MVDVKDPSTGEIIGTIMEADEATCAAALDAAKPWDAPVSERARILHKAADALENNFGMLFAVLAREAGKIQPDTVGELREAVDFMRYYADQAEALPAAKPVGLMVAISPWNFPLAIFVGQVCAALAVGNGVLAKPAEQTSIVATRTVELLHAAGVPLSALQLITGTGVTVGAALTRDPRVNGVVFTGSTQTAQRIRSSMAEFMQAGAPLIAETGGLNAMIVDSTALPQQATRDIVASAFQSAGQRCSALRCLYVQEDIAPALIKMIQGAMDELSMGNPWDLSTDVGPVIDTTAHTSIAEYIENARSEGRVLHSLEMPTDPNGTFIAPTMIKVSSIQEMAREIFGPVLHVATYKASEIDQVIADINGMGYGLTFGLHTRIDSRVQTVCEKIKAGNMYVNRNQIGAIVGSQPFGGEGQSGTGPKAGGPLYLTRMIKGAAVEQAQGWTHVADAKAVQNQIDQIRTETSIDPLNVEYMPGPTGEANTMSMHQRDPILCLGPSKTAMQAQIASVQALGGLAVGVEGTLTSDDLIQLTGFAGVLYWGADARPIAQALAHRKGAILPVITTQPDLGHVSVERHLCVDTTAAGGNAALLAG